LVKSAGAASASAATTTAVAAAAEQDPEQGRKTGTVAQVQREGSCHLYGGTWFHVCALNMGQNILS